MSSSSPDPYWLIGEEGSSPERRTGMVTSSSEVRRKMGAVLAICWCTLRAMSTESMSGSVERTAFEASKKQKGGVSACSSSGGMTKTFGICTVLKEEGGTARPGESKEREEFIAESRRCWFKKCSTPNLPYLYIPTRLLRYL